MHLQFSLKPICYPNMKMCYLKVKKIYKSDLLDQFLRFTKYTALFLLPSYNKKGERKEEKCMYIFWHFKTSLDWSTYWMWCICKKLNLISKVILYHFTIHFFFLILLNANIDILYQIYFEYKDHRRSRSFLQINLLLDSVGDPDPQIRIRLFLQGFRSAKDPQ